MRTTGRWRYLVLGLVLGGVFLLLSTRGLRAADVLHVLRDASLPPIALAVAATFSFMAIKAWRWSVILRAGVAVDLRLLHWVTYVGSAGNLVVVHSGELLRALIVGRRTGAAPSAVLASIGIERVFDMFAVVMLLSVMLLTDLEFTDSLKAAALVALGMAAAGLAGIWVLLKPSRMRDVVVGLAEALLPAPVGRWLTRQARRSVVGLVSLGSPRTVLTVLALSLVQWSCIVAAIWLTVAALGQPVPVPAAIGVWVLMVVGLTLPSSPAQLGTTQLAYTLGLALVGAEHDVAFAASVIYTCAVNLPIMVIGAVCWLMIRRSDLAIRPIAQES